jgi:hypothetical protein
MTARICDHSTWKEPKEMRKTFPSTAKPAAFGPTDMKAVTEVGAPS